MLDRSLFFNPDTLWRFGLVHIVNIILFTLNLAALSLPYSGQIRPYFILIILFYWSVHRPSLLHPAFIFVLGLIFDVILNFPIGLHAIMFLGVHWGLSNQRLFFTGQSYHIIWAGFAILTAFILSIEWMFFGLVTGGWGAAMPLFFSFLLTILLFPIITLLFALLHRILPEMKHF